MHRNGTPEGAKRVTLITGGFDRPYVYGLTMALARRGLTVDVIGSDALDGAEMRSTPGVRFYRYQTMSRAEWPFWRKLASVGAYYLRLGGYLATTPSKIVHVLWNNKLVYFDRTAMMLALRASGKRPVLTAHNVNTKKRDGRDSWLNRVTLRCQYRLASCVFVHTESAARELQDDFGVPDRRTEVIPFGINDSIPVRGIDSRTAKTSLGLREEERVILFYGSIRPYKGLHYLLEAFEKLTVEERVSYRLLIAGDVKKEEKAYWRQLSERIAHSECAARITQRIEFIPDEETETYFLAADVLALPYTQVYQSGVLFLSYNYGLPVVATRAGSLAGDVVVGETGFLCEPGSAESLAVALRRYFASELYGRLSERRKVIRSYASQKHSWDGVASQIVSVYSQLVPETSKAAR